MLFTLLNSVAMADGFIGGTIVKTPNGFEPIEQLAVGDIVISCNFAGDCVERAITAVSQKKVKDYAEIKIGNEKISVGLEQMFYAPENNRWISAMALEESDKSIALMNSNYANLPVQNIKIVYNKPVTIFRLTVEENHNFYVSKADVLVHNLGGVAAVAMIAAAALFESVDATCYGDWSRCSEWSRELGRYIWNDCLTRCRCQGYAAGVCTLVENTCAILPQDVWVNRCVCSGVWYGPRPDNCSF